MESNNSLEDAALKRKERLLSLKRKREVENGVETNKNVNIEELPRPKFRSYNPSAAVLAENKLPDPQLVNIDDEIADQLKSAKAKVVLEDLDISTLAPRKPDWDLKRDVAKKLEKLERRTQRAIAELIRDRLKQRLDDIGSVVNVATIESENR